MTQQYLRIVEAKIEGGPTFRYDASSPQQNPNGPADRLRIRFQTTQADKSTPNLLELFVTNLKDETTQAAFFTDRQVTLSAGYPGAVGLLFRGQIKQARNTREDVTDKILHIIAADQSTPRNYAVVNRTLPANHTHYDRAMVAIEALQAMGCTVGYIAKDALTKTKFPRGFAMFGMAKDTLRDICIATKTSWSIRNGAVQIVENDKPGPGQAIMLSGSTGLVGRAVQTIQGIEGTTLINPYIVPSATVRLDSRLIDQAVFDQSYTGAARNGLIPKLATDGLYKVFQVGHQGDTHGNDFHTKFIGTRLSDKSISTAAAVRGINTPNG